jgi:zinc transporter ZupT
VPAFLFVQQFVRFLPVGLWFAAWAMIRMSFSELLPDAIHDVPKETVATIITIGVVSMIVFQSVLGV